MAFRRPWGVPEREVELAVIPGSLFEVSEKRADAGASEKEFGIPIEAFHRRVEEGTGFLGLANRGATLGDGDDVVDVARIERSRTRMVLDGIVVTPLVLGDESLGVREIGGLVADGEGAIDSVHRGPSIALLQVTARHHPVEGGVVRIKPTRLFQRDDGFGNPTGIELLVRKAHLHLAAKATPVLLRLDELLMLWDGLAGCEREAR